MKRTRYVKKATPEMVPETVGWAPKLTKREQELHDARQQGRQDGREEAERYYTERIAEAGQKKELREAKLKVLNALGQSMQAQADYMRACSSIVDEIRVGLV